MSRVVDYSVELSGAQAAVVVCNVIAFFSAAVEI